MRVGKPAVYTHNIRLTSTAQLAATLIRTAPDPMSAGAYFLTQLANGLAPAPSSAPSTSAPRLAGASNFGKKSKYGGGM